MAASVMAVLPIIIVFFIAQRYFVSSIIMTGLREG
jgi:ABC-type glycerol-3-phosphate transport system permease component